MLQKDGSILISSEDFIKGIARSPYLGIGNMVNLDIHSLPGTVQIAKALEKESGSTVLEWIRFAGVDYATGDIFGLDQDGNLYKRATNGVWTDVADFGTTDDGMFVWKSWVIALRNGTTALAEAYGPLTGTSSVQSFFNISFDHSSTATFVSLVTKDDRVYFGADNVLHELVENSGQDFNPTDSGTFTKSEQVLILPEGVVITAIAELGSNIIVGTSYGDVQTIADIFIWNPNKSGADETAPDERISLGGDGVKHVEELDNLIYALVGNNAKLKVTDITNVREVVEVQNISNTPDTSYTFTPITQSSTKHDSGIVFGLYKDAAEPALYQYKNNALTAFTTSQGQVTEGVRIGAVFSINDDQLYVTWHNRSDDSYGVDVTSTDSRYQNYSAYLESQLYTVSRDHNGKSYSEIGFTLGKPLATDQGIRFKYRTGLDENWTTFKTLDYDTIGAVTAYRTNADLPTSFKTIQIRVELTTGTSDTSPLLKEVYLV